MGNNTKYNNFYVLGDSLSDTGALVGILNNYVKKNTISFDKPFYEGRSFSNGKMAVEYVAQCLGLELNPGWSFTSIFGKQVDRVGQNYAISNATASEISHPLYEYFFNKFQLKNQLDALIKHHQDIGPKDLFLIMIGGNDVMLACKNDSQTLEIIDSQTPEIMLEKAVKEICNALRVLNKNSVKHVIVANVPDIGLIPFFNKSVEKAAEATKLTDYFNTHLNLGLESIEDECPNLKIKQLDLYSKMQSIIDEYKSKGLNYQDANISDISDKFTMEILRDLILHGKFESRYNPGCSEDTFPQHMFFDFFHPTERPHQEVGNELCKLIGVDKSNTWNNILRK